MASELKVLSAVLVPNEDHRESGEAKLDFATNTVTGDGHLDTLGVDDEKIGPDTEFVSEPCKVVSLRSVKIPAQGGGDFDLTDHYLDSGHKKSIKISWKAPPGGEIRKISYMFIGYGDDKR